MLGGVDLADAGLIELLDGTRDLDELSAEAERRGHPARARPRARPALGDAAALDDAPRHAARSTPAGSPTCSRCRCCTASRAAPRG